MLSAEDIEFCTKLGLEVGVDVDTQDPQKIHICWPYSANTGTLCNSKFLWFHAQGIADTKMVVDCEDCFLELKQIMQLEYGYDSIFDTMGKLAAATNSLKEIYFATNDFLWSLDNPKAAKKLDPAYKFRTTLDNALEAEEERWSQLCKEDKVVCDTCNDTHKMPFHSSSFDEITVMCTRCPVPCQDCRVGGNGAFCEETPCKCVCHMK